MVGSISSSREGLSSSEDVQDSSRGRNVVRDSLHPDRAAARSKSRSRSRSRSRPDFLRNAISERLTKRKSREASSTLSPPPPAPPPLPDFREKTSRPPVKDSYMLYPILLGPLKDSYDLDIVVVHGPGTLSRNVSILNASGPGDLEKSPVASKSVPSTGPKIHGPSARLHEASGTKPKVLIPDVILSSASEVATDHPADVTTNGPRDTQADLSKAEKLLIDSKIDSNNLQAFEGQHLSMELIKLAREMTSARFLAFEYPEPRQDGQPSSLSEVINQLFVKLVAARSKCADRPIFFIGHDFGSMVIEKLLLDSATDSTEICLVAAVTVGVIFLWTTAGGSDLLKREASYFENKEARVSWLKKLRDKGETHRSTPRYKELNHPAVGAFLKQHIGRFKSLYEHLSRFRPAMALLSVRFDDKVASNVCNMIKNSLQAYQLLDAAITGNEVAIGDLMSKSLLDQDVSIVGKKIKYVDLQDSMGRSALHLAILTNRLDVVSTLLRIPGANISIKDNQKRNALHFAALHCSGKPLKRIVPILVNAGVPLDTLDRDGLSASQALVNKGVRKASLLKRTPYMGPSHEANPVRKHPVPPRSTAAELACYDFLATLAEFYHVDGQKEEIIMQHASIYELLYDSKSGPEQILNPARGSHRKDCPSFKWYHLPVNHLKWVDDLLARSEIITEPLQQDQHNGKPYWSRYMRPQARIIESQKQIQEPAPVVGVERQLTRDFALFVPFLNFERRCDHVSLSKFTDILKYQRTGIEKYKWEIEKQAAFEEKLFKERILDEIRRVEYRKALYNRKLFEQQLYEQDAHDRSTFANSPETSEPGSSDAEADDAEADAPAAIELLPPRDPSADSPTSPSLPPLTPDRPMVTQPKARQNSGENERQKSDPLQSEKDLIDGYLLEDTPTKFHQRRTLDQSHYFMLEETSERDADQVILRRARGQWLERNNDPPDDEKHPLIMVDQLWIWVFGNTVITSFPQSWMKEDYQREGDVLEHLLNHLLIDKSRDPITTAHDFANLVVHYCVSVFNRRSNLELCPVQDLFGLSVNKAANDQMKLFRDFEDDSERMMQHYKMLQRFKTKGTRKMLDKLLAIDSEIKLLDELKDIRDEINMILRILDDQDMVVREMSSILQPETQEIRSANQQSPQEFIGLERIVTRGHSRGFALEESQGANLKARQTRHRVINDNIRDFRRMLVHVNLTYEELHHLLDLKQKQANAWEARLARANADSTARQSNTITVFTVATIVFGSLSFVTAFFALNISAFPHTGGVTTWGLGYVVIYVVLIAMALSLPFIYIALRINFLTRNIVRFIRYLTKKVRLRSDDDDEDDEYSDVGENEAKDEKSHADSDDAQDPNSESQDQHNPRWRDRVDVVRRRLTPARNRTQESESSPPSPATESNSSAVFQGAISAHGSSNGKPHVLERSGRIRTL